MERCTYWCHQCDMSISIIPTTTTTCPHCTSDFLEELDSPITFNNYSNESFLLESPYFHRLINHLYNSIPITTTTTSAIDAIPTVTITHTFFKNDPSVICAVCNEQFVIDDEMKELPWKHIYHPHCIVQWLSLSNSCPVCRFEMPSIKANEGDLNVRRMSRTGDDDEEEELSGFGLMLSSWPNWAVDDGDIAASVDRIDDDADLVMS